MRSVTRVNRDTWSKKPDSIIYSRLHFITKNTTEYSVCIPNGKTFKFFGGGTPTHQPIITNNISPNIPYIYPTYSRNTNLLTLPPLHLVTPYQFDPRMWLHRTRVCASTRYFSPQFYIALSIFLKNIHFLEIVPAPHVHST